MNSFSITIGISAVIGIISAILMIKNSPRDINWLYGYRTALAMKNQENWDFAQKFSAVLMLKSSLVLLILAFAGLLFNFEALFGVIAGIFILILWVAFLFFTTQKAINKFEKRSN